MDTNTATPKTLTLTLTPVEAVALVNCCSFAIALLMCRDEHAALAATKDAIIGLERLGPQATDAICETLTRFAAEADPKHYQAVTYDQKYGADRPVTLTERDATTDRESGVA